MNKAVYVAVCLMSIGCNVTSVDKDGEVGKQIRAVQDGKSDGILFYETKETARQIKRVLSESPNITSVSFEMSDLNDSGLALLPAFKLLRTINLGSEPGITIRGIESLKDCPNLVKVVYYGHDQAIKEKLINMGWMDEKNWQAQ